MFLVLCSTFSKMEQNRALAMSGFQRFFSTLIHLFSPSVRLFQDAIHRC